MNTHRVALVFEENFSIQLCKLAQQMHTWIVDTPINRSSVSKYWEKNRSPSDMNELKDGATLFQRQKGNLSEAVSDVFELIEDHHGEFAHNPPVSEIHIFGLDLTKNIEEVIKDFGFVAKKDGDSVLAFKSP